MSSDVLALRRPGSQAEVEREGAGPPLLYLHGAFGLEWSRPLLTELAKAYDVVAPHLPGYGETNGLEHVKSFYETSVFLEELLDALGLGAVTVVGHDFGGAVAAEFAALFPARVERLVLVAPYGLWRNDLPVGDIFGLTPGALTRLIFADGEGEPARSFNQQAADKREARRAILRRRQALVAAAKLLWPVPDKGIRHRLYRVSAPALVVWGQEDRMMPPVYAEDWAAAITGARCALVPGGHMLPMESAGEVAAEVARFAGR